MADPIWQNLPAYQQWAAVIAGNARVYGLPEGLLESLLFKESSYSPAVINGTRRSKVGAYGIAQFTAPTARALGVDPLWPPSAINGAARYLSALFKTFGSWSLALAAYNWGPGNVRAWLAGRKTFVPIETARYVQHITGRPLTRTAA